VHFVSYNRGHQLRKDGSDELYPDPHWEPDEDASSPYLYCAGETMHIETVVWRCWNRQFPPETEFTVRGVGYDNVTFETTTKEFQVVWDEEVYYTEITARNLTADRVFPQTTRKDFRIDWQISWDESGLKDADYSICPIYVCLSSNVGNPFRAVAHAAAGDGGATTYQQAFLNTWNLFKAATSGTPHFILPYDDQLEGEPLHYYKEDTDFDTNLPDAYLLNPVTWLLLNRTGQCGTWREFFKAALELNDVPALRTMVRPVVGYRYFLVQNWIPIPDIPQESYDFAFAPNAGYDMVPKPYQDQYGEFRNAIGIPGQNSDTPSEKVFTCHFIIEYNGEYYDPSYGKKYGNEAQTKAALKNAIWGLANHGQDDDDEVHLVVKQPEGDWIRLIPGA